jgi:hypothetical protein
MMAPRTQLPKGRDAPLPDPTFRIPFRAAHSPIDCGEPGPSTAKITSRSGSPARATLA